MADSVVPQMVINGIKLAPAQPSLTYSFDPDTNRISGRVDGAEAVAQWVRHAISAQRYANVVYSPQFGTQLYEVLGSGDVSQAFLECEIKRQVREALLPDERITGVSNIDVTFTEDGAYVALDISTVFGDAHVESEVI